MPVTTASTVRIDKWLLAARLFKTRTIAQAACDGGHVAINDRTAEPAHPVKVGDVVSALTPGGRRIYRVVALGEKRGPTEVARTYFEDLTPPEPPQSEPLALRDRGAGRPTKRDRRQIERIRDL